VQAMTAISLDEVSHLQAVSRILARRGGRLTQSHANRYAADLHQLIRRGQANFEIADHLLVSALIEARSCERFCLLASNCPDEELRRVYIGLWRSEAGHYRIFLQLAKDLPASMGVDERWNEMLDAEAEIVRRQKPGPRMHSGVATA
jgi:tRNA 2-(methylsulfanyl)-N6-isopentenyladenosine37 hydroxylase